MQRLICRRKIKPDLPPVELDNWPWPVKVYTLGRFAILRDNEKIEVSKKTKKKPLTMLKALIAFGGRGVREEAKTSAAIATDAMTRAVVPVMFSLSMRNALCSKPG